MYAIFAALWIYTSDRALALVTQDVELLARLSMFKGLLFVIVSFTLLLVLLRPAFAHDEERWLAETTAASEKSFSETMIESMPGVAYFYDGQGRFLRWNRNFEAVSGYSAEEVALMHPLDFISGEDRRMVQERIGEAFEKGEAFVETGFVTRDGRAIPYYFTARRVVFDGTPCLVGVGLDISERRRAEEMQLRLAAIVNSSSEAIISKTTEGIITSWNPGAARLFGYREEEMIGRPIGILVPPDRMEEELEILERIAAGESMEHLDTVRVRKDGVHIDVSVTVSPLLDGEGRVVGASKIARDITLLRARAREIERLSRLYSALSHVNQSIVQATTREELFQKVCRVLVEHGGFQMAWIGWNDPVSHQLVPAAVWGEGSDYVRTITLYSDDRPEGRGPSGVAFRENRPEVRNDLLENDAILPWRPEMVRHGFRSSAAFPVVFQGAVAGILNVYAGETGYFQDKEVALLSEAARDLSFALDNLARDLARREAEQSVRSERDFSEAMLNSLPGVLYLYDREGRFLRWNRNLEHVTGYSPSELALMHPLDFIAGPDRELVATRIEEAFTYGDSSVEADVLTKDAQVIPYYLTGVATRLGGETCLVGVGIDISVRKKAEADRIATEGRYKTLFEQAPDGIVIADSAGVYLDANASLCRMLGYSREEMIGQHSSAMVVESEVPNIEPALSAIKDRIGYHREWQFRRKDGSTFSAEVIATVMPDGNVMGMIRDITERKQAERVLREMNETLETRVVERTAELQTALVRAESADRLKSAFLATMSHELRTPLNSIIGFTGILQQGLAGPLNEEQSRQLGMVRGSARHLLDVINDVLDLSKIEAGQLEIRVEPFDLPETIERVAGSLGALAATKNLSVELNIASDVKTMVSDQRRVEQILINLLGNAIKFTDQGRIRLSADLVPRGEHGSEAGMDLRLRVADTGIGIRPEDLDVLFRPFQQLDTGLTRMHEGTGLGLVICRRLAALLGGEITVASEWTKGSEFTVTVPLERVS